MPAPIRVFISYSPKDDGLREELLSHLAPLTDQGVLESWHDRMVVAGEEPADDIRARLDAAQVILLLVSADFLASREDRDVEVARALARHAAGEAHVIPVIVRACAWDAAPFAALSCLPRGGRPVKQWPDRDEAWIDVVRGLRDAIAEIAKRAAETPALAAPKVAAVLPPAGRCIGRDAVVDQLVAALLDEAPRPVPILGPAGIGKSTVTRAALHRREIAARYGARRWFVRLDAALTEGAMTAAIAAAIGLDPDPKQRPRALAELARERGLLVLDNLETPWEHDRDAVEALLAELAEQPVLSLVVSARGAARPGGVPWGEPIRLGKLDTASALDVFCDIAGEHHRRAPALGRLLARQEGVPLAVTLLAHAAEANDAENLEMEWEARRTALLARDGGPRDRLSSWAVSLELSVGSERMTGEARRLLAVLAALPDGVASADLDALLPSEGPSAARVLAQVGLAFFEAGRLRTLAPIRDHVAAAHRPEPADLQRTMDHFGELARAHGPKIGRPGGADALFRLDAEIANIDAMIQRGLAGPDPSRWIEAALALRRFAVSSGRAAPSSLSAALAAARAAGNDRHEAACLEALGDIALKQSRPEEAEARYGDALALCRRTGDVRGEASCIMRLGDIVLDRSDFFILPPSAYDTPRAQFEEALRLYRQAGDTGGEANCVQRLGDVALRTSRRDEAAACFAQALPVYREVGDVRGEANCIAGLGEVALAQARYDEARGRYEEALPLYRKAGSARGEANCLVRLGDLAAPHAPAEARDRYGEGLAIFRTVGAARGEANCLVRLADFALTSARPEEASEAYSAALAIYRKHGPSARAAKCMRGLGYIALRGALYSEAARWYDEALPLCRRGDDLLGEADCLLSLGDAALGGGQRDDARARYDAALALYAATAERHPTGLLHWRLATLAEGPSERRRHAGAARAIWDEIARPDLCAKMDAELGPEAQGD